MIKYLKTICHHLQQAMFYISWYISPENLYNTPLSDLIQFSLLEAEEALLIDISIDSKFFNIRTSFEGILHS